MREDGTKVPLTFKDEIASGIGGSEAKLQHVKHQKFDQPAPSNQSDGRGSTPVIETSINEKAAEKELSTSGATG